MMKERSNGCALLDQTIGFLQWNLRIDCNWIPWGHIDRIEDYYGLAIRKEWNRENRVNAKSLRLVVVYLNERDLADFKVSKGLAKDRPDLERNDTFEFPWSSTFRKSENLTY